MRALIVIPARLASSRLPGKMLRRIGGRPLIQWTYEAACKAKLPVVIATDSERIEEEGDKLGATVIRTSANCINGTERCAEVLELIDETPEVIVNWQGDSPCIPPDVPSALIDHLLFSTAVAVTTPVRYVDTLAPGEACVAQRMIDHRALFFSRSQIPSTGPWWAHVGMYCYRALALRSYGRKPSPLELAEGLEQNRWLEQDAVVRCVPCDRMGDCPEVNVAADIGRVAKELGVA